MKLYNYTPHNVIIMSEHQEILIPSSGIARCEAIDIAIGKIECLIGDPSECYETPYGPLADDVPIYRTEYGAVSGLPEPKKGVGYIVSLLVAQALPERSDLFSPGELVRDDQGRPIACRGLRQV